MAQCFGCERYWGFGKVGEHSLIVVSCVYRTQEGVRVSRTLAPSTGISDVTQDVVTGEKKGLIRHYYIGSNVHVQRAGINMNVAKIGALLVDQNRPLKERFRALFTLKSLGGAEAVDSICECFADPSALLKHEAAFCLGQMQDKLAVKKLLEVLQDDNQEPIVRHEAGEALGAIGAEEALETLQKYESSPITEIAETCQLAVGRIKWMMSNGDHKTCSTTSIYDSVDPAPPSDVTNVAELRETLLNEKLPLFERYRAMFSLRNNGSKDAVLALAEGLKCSSALFRHEIAYVLGQVQSEHSVEALAQNLKDQSENCMVRHECAEALGSIATPECTGLLKEYLADTEPVVKESCEIALDICDYAKSSEFQYANGLISINGS